MVEGISLEQDKLAWEQRQQNGELKEAINQFIWTNGNPEWTLYFADRLATKIYNVIVYGTLGN